MDMVLCYLFTKKIAQLNPVSKKTGIIKKKKTKNETFSCAIKLNKKNKNAASNLFFSITWSFPRHVYILSNPKLYKRNFLYCNLNKGMSVDVKKHPYMIITLLLHKSNFNGQL